MNSTTIQVTGYENRGDAKTQYGFVYFSDDTRVAYTSFSGVEGDATGGWGAISEQHVKAATEYLTAQGVLTS